MNNILELKNDLHRLVVETEDLNLLKQARQLLINLRPNELKRSEEKAESNPVRPNHISPSIQYKNGGWVYTGMLRKNVGFASLLEEARDERIDFLTQSTVQQ